MEHAGEFHGKYENVQKKIRSTSKTNIWGVSIVMGVPTNGWFERENPHLEIDDDWGVSPFMETPIWDI